MQALREIRDVISDRVTFKIPRAFSAKRVEIIVLSLDTKRKTDKTPLEGN